MNGALTIARFGDRWEILREDEGIRRRIGILHHREDAELFVVAPELLTALKAMLAECGNPWVRNDGTSQLTDLIARAEERG